MLGSSIFRLLALTTVPFSNHSRVMLGTVVIISLCKLGLVKISEVIELVEL